MATLSRCGFDCQMPGGTYFLYTPSPKLRKGAAGGSRDVRDRRGGQPVSDHRAIDLHGAVGRRRARICGFSVTYEAADEAAEDALMAETESRLKNIKPVF